MGKIFSPEFPDRTLLELAPLIYLAWSDGRLTEDEIERIRTRLGEQPMSAAVRAILEEWLNPQQPPTPSELYALLELMQTARAGRRRRFEAFYDMRRLFNRSPAAPEAEAETPELRALRELEAALGVSGDEVLRTILKPDTEPGDDPLALPAAERLAQFVDGDRYDIRRFVFGVLQRPVFERTDLESTEAYRERVLTWCRELARLGVSSYGYPMDFEGEGNVAKAIAAFETLAYHDLSLLVKFGVQFGLFGGSILQLGEREHHERYLPAVMTLELPGCFAMSETGHGSNVRDLQTTASYDMATDEFLVDTPTRAAWKDYIGNAALHARMAVVFAQLEVNGHQHGVHAFLVPIRDEHGNVLPGVQVEDCGRKIGLNGVDNGRIAFRAVRIPRANLLSRFGRVGADGTYDSSIADANRRFFTMLGTLVAGRISIAAASCSAAKLGLHITARYAARRKQFGPEGEPEVALITYRAVQRRLLPLIARTYALDFAIHDTVKRLRLAADDQREIELRAAALKAAASRHAVDALQYARELCGGQGYLWVNRIGELRADTDVFTTFEGANDVLLQLVAKGLLTELREQFEETRVWATIKHVTARAGSAVTDLNPVTTRRTDQAHLRDPGFHASALSYRETRLLRSVAARLRRLMAEGHDAFSAVNECQDHIMKLAEAHAERIVLESFQERVERAADSASAAALAHLCALHGLVTLEAHRAWFLESGYLEPVKSKAIRAEVGRLCRELHHLAGALTDGWGIPERYLPEIVRQTLVAPDSQPHT